MSTTELTFAASGPNIVLVSTASIGPPGPAGPPGSVGPAGDTGLPGTELTLTIDPTTHDPILTVTTHWWIDTDGSAYYEDNPANVPVGKEAWFDPGSFSVIPGLPGTTNRVVSINGLTGAVTLNAPIIGSDAWLITEARNQNWSFTSASYDANGAALTANVVWTDGATGVYTAVIVSTTFLGAVDAWRVTHVLNTVTKTINQPAVTRDSNGRITALPPMTVA